MTWGGEDSDAVLITGGTGFIGRHVAAEALRRRHAVHVLSRRAQPVAPATSATHVQFVTHDLREPSGLDQVLQGIDCVIHCAALLDGTGAEMQAVTVDGTRNLLEAMARAGVEHIIGLSTLAIYDYQGIPSWSVLDERTPLETRFERRHPYVRAKSAQESLIVDTARTRGWRCTILRPGVVYGPGRTWFHHLGVRLGPKLWLCLAGESPLPLVFVEHLANAVLSAAETPASDAVTLNIVDDDAPPRGEYTSELARREAPHPFVTTVPWGVMDAASRAASAMSKTVFGGRLPLPDLLRPASLHERSKPLRYANALAKQRLGWQPTFSLRDALDRCY